MAINELNEIKGEELIIRTQTLSESGLRNIPARYVSRAAPARAPGADGDGDEDGISDNLRQDVPDIISRGLLVDDGNNIPVLKLSDFASRRDGFLHELRHACRTWGFFQIVDHGVPLSLLQRMHATQREFFALPSSFKEAYANSPPLVYDGYGTVLGDPSVTGSRVDWRDYFYATLLPISQRDTAKWPLHPPHWRTTIEEYYNHIYDLSMELLQVLSLSLSLPFDSLLNAFLNGCNVMDQIQQQKIEEKLDMGFGVNYYPCCPQPDLTFGLSHHSDPGGITILSQDEKVPGLQVRFPYEDEKWIPVRPYPGALVVNLGDQVEILTNGLYRSVEHRVLVNQSKSRISIVCFLNPNNDSIMAPLPHFITKEKPNIFKPISFKDYRSLIRKNGTNGKGYLRSISKSTI